MYQWCGWINCIAIDAMKCIGDELPRLYSDFSPVRFFMSYAILAYTIPPGRRSKIIKTHATKYSNISFTKV